MTVRNNHTHSDTHSFEVALKRLLNMARDNECDPQGTYTVPTPASEVEAYTVEITVEPTANGYDQEIKHSQCLDCEWSVNTAEYPPQETSSRVVRHAVKTGHDIDSSYIELSTEFDDNGSLSSRDYSSNIDSSDTFERS
jgi:hypothetical protein